MSVLGSHVVPVMILSHVTKCRDVKYIYCESGPLDRFGSVMSRIS